MLFPVALAVMAYKYVKLRNFSFIEISISSCILVQLIWCVYGLPSSLARISLLNMVPETRALSALGVASIILTMLASTSLNMKNLNDRRFSWYLGAIAFVLVLLFGLSLERLSIFYSSRKALLIAFFITIIVIALLQQRIRLSIFLILLALSPHFLVNPLTRGLAPVLENRFTKKFRKIDNRDSGVWVVYGASISANFLKAAGLTVFNGVQFTPKTSLYEHFNSATDAQIINRFAHIGFAPAEPDQQYLTYISPDCYVVNLDPCSRIIKQLGIKYILMPAGDYQPTLNNNCQLKKIRLNNSLAEHFQIYKVIKQ
jgi:hypothetical protein